MQGVIGFLRDNATWLFGGGGLAAFVLALMKRGADKPAAPANVSVTLGQSGKAGAISAGNTTIARTGLGGVDLALILAVVVCLMGGALWLLGPRDGDVVVTGNGNAIATGAGSSATAVTSGAKK